MIKELLGLIKWTFKLIFKGFLYFIKGLSWLFTNFDYVIRDFKILNRKYPKTPKKEEII